MKHETLPVGTEAWLVMWGCHCSMASSVNPPEKCPRHGAFPIARPELITIGVADVRDGLVVPCDCPAHPKPCHWCPFAGCDNCTDRGGVRTCPHCREPHDGECQLTQEGLPINQEGGMDAEDSSSQA